MSEISGMFQDLTKIKDARNGRLASWDQRGQNQDYWEIPAGESITLGEIEGPGCITHIDKDIFVFLFKSILISILHSLSVIVRC